MPLLSSELTQLCLAAPTWEMMAAWLGLVGNGLHSTSVPSAHIAHIEPQGGATKHCQASKTPYSKVFSAQNRGQSFTRQGRDCLHLICG